MKLREKTKEHLPHIIKILQTKTAELHSFHSEQKETEESLKNSKQQYRMALDSVSDSIHVVDSDLRIIFINKTFKRWMKLLGLRADVIGCAVFEVFPFLSEKVKKEYQDVFKKGKVLITQEHTKVGDREFITETRKIPIKEQGQVIRIVTIVKNITERKKMEITLRESEQIKTAILNSMLEHVVYHDKTMRIIWVNKAAAESVRLSAKELIGRYCYEVWHQRSEPCLNCPVIRARETGQVQKEEIITPDGRVWFIKGYSLKDSRGEVYGLVETTLEITKRKKAQEELKENEEKYRSLVSNIPAITWISDEYGRTIFISPNVKKFYGYTQEEIYKMGEKLWLGRIHPDDMERVKKEYGKLFSEGKVFDVEYRIQRKDGQWIWINDKTFSTHEKDGIRCAYGFFIDVTKRKQAEQEKDKLTKELMSSNRRMKQLALRDSQTGLYNHRYLEDVIEAEFYRAKRYVHPLSVIMLDIDYFKSINDAYGHQFGDLVLKQLARQLKMMVRRYDTVIRSGGEEFVILSPGTDRAMAVKLAQRILNAVNLYDFGSKKHTVKLSLSIAVVSFPEDKLMEEKRSVKIITTGIDLINFGDKILDKIKESGGNKVYSYWDVRTKGENVFVKGKEVDNIKLLESKLEKFTKQANQSLIEAVFAFAKTIELKDHYTGEHVEKTVQYAIEIAENLFLSREEVEHIKQAAILHDLGKIGISEAILCKQSKLTKEEFEIIKTHPQIGVDIIRPVHLLHDLIPSILYHHERWDGKGYPGGLKGTEIPLGARIVSLADVYQALISDRPYRKSFSNDDALMMIRNGSGTQFDPKIVDVFVKLFK